MSTINQPSLGFVIIFLIFSVMFISNSYKLWFKTEEYYQNIYNSLAHGPAIIPFQDFFFRRVKNKEKWLLGQKVFSLLGITAVLAADVLVVMAYVQ